MASTVYEAGRVLASVVLLGGAAATLRAGLAAERQGVRDFLHEQARRRESGEPELAPVPPRGQKQVWAGVALLVLGAVSGYGSAISHVRHEDRVAEIRVALPDTLLGMHRHDTYVDPSAAAKLRSSMGSLTEVDVGYYGSPFGGLLAVSARGDVGDAKDEVRSFFAGVEEAASVANRQAVEPATAGGVAECAQVTVDSATGGAATRFACIWADDRTLVGTVDGEAKDVTDAGRRGREAHRLIVRKEGDPPPKAVAASTKPPVVIDMPAKVLGYTRDDDSVGADRIRFVQANERWASTSDMALYLGDEDGFLVEGLTTDLSSHGGLVRTYRTSLQKETGKDPGAPVSVLAGGPRPGKGYCWKLTLEKLPAVACLLADDAAFVTVYSYGSHDVAAAAARARQVRAAVEKPNP